MGSIAGNTKCHCGSGKKYKKCCKKLQKHGGKNKKYTNHFDNVNDDNVNDFDMVNRLNDAIEHFEHQINHFKGKKNDKIKMMKELDKLRRQRDAYQRQANKWQKSKNKQKNNNRRWEKPQHSNGYNIDKTVVAKTIAI